MLKITDLHVAIAGKTILQGLDLTVGAGEVHAIMGPNGAGKSTLTKALMGHPAYEIIRGSIAFDGRDLDGVEIEERASRGLFIGFQYPVEVPGVNNADFLFLALNAQRQNRGEAALDRPAFDRLLDSAIAEVQAQPSWRERDLNTGFSGGEKKRNEILQMFVLQPRLVVLDETDSGLDIDALRIVAAGINAYRRADRAIVLITHYQRLLSLVQPDRVHVLAGGRIAKSGGKELALELERTGYAGEAKGTVR